MMLRQKIWLSPLPFLVGILLSLQFVGFAQNKFLSKTDSLQTALAIAVTDTGRVNILNELAATGDCEERLEYADRAFVIAEKTGWRPGIYLSLIRKGDTYKECLKEFPAAIRCFKELEKLAIQNNDTHRIITAYTELGNLYKITGQYALAINFYNKITGLTLLKHIMIGNYGNLGQVYFQVNDYENAIKSYQQSLDILNDTIIADKHLPSSYKAMQTGLMITMADIYLAMGDNDKALAAYAEALEINKELKYIIVNCFAEKGLGQCYLNKNEVDKSIVHFEQALDAAKNSIYKEDILNHIARAWLVKGDKNKALDHCREAIALSEKNNNKAQLAVAYTTMGEILSGSGAYNDAARYIEQAVQLAKEAGLREEEKNAWEALSETYTKLKQPAKAFEAYRNFIGLRDSLYNADKAKEMTRLMMQGDFDRERVADSVAQADADKQAALKLRRQRNYTYTGIGAFLIVLGFSFVIMKERKKSDKLLLNILPVKVAEELKQKGTAEARQFDNVTVLFTDFVGFTTVSERLTPKELVEELHQCFKAFDEITAKYGIEKIKTVGDAYLAVCGLPLPDASHAEKVIHAAMEIRDFIKARKEQLGDSTFNIRIGVNSGTVVAGIVGVKKFAYDIWGDTVNTAARMEQNSEPGKINITDNTYQLIKDKFTCTYRGEHTAKNKGMLKMYFAEGITGQNI
jgi:adenylate cyclase